jgi:hypothetical protein
MGRNALVVARSGVAWEVKWREVVAAANTRCYDNENDFFAARREPYGPP